MKNRYLCILTFCLAASILVCGCGKKADVNGKVVAKINDYKLTVDDFRDEANAAFANKYVTGDPEKAKESLLDEVILKKILLQEAQAQNFDKDRAFMKEIERYWEQALLKLLIKKKMMEFLQKTTVSEDEVKAEYEKMKTEEGPISSRSKKPPHS